MTSFSFRKQDIGNRDSGVSKRLFSSVGKVARRFLLAPLAATMLYGCADECKSFNETTIMINRKTDGVVSNTDDLKKKPEQGIMNAAVIDLINETEALSSPGLPFPTNITLVPEYCMTGGRAYAVPAVMAITSDVGIYVQRQITIDSVRTVAHEIGHVQQNGKDEVFAMLNEFEQRLIGSVLLSRQGWAEKISEDPIFGEKGYWLVRFFVASIWNAKNGLADYSEISALDIYLKSNIFIFLQLVELDGDIQALRDYITSQEAKGTTYIAVDVKIGEFIKNPTFGYYDRGKSAAVAEVKLQLMMLFVKEVARRFGPDDAFNTFLTDIYPRSALDLTDTDYPFCSKINNAKPDETQLDKRFCCISIDRNNWDDFPVFRKWIIAVDKTANEIRSKKEIALNAPCE